MTETPIKAVELMRRLRDRIHEECRGMSWEERRAHLLKKVERHPVLGRWVERSKTKTESS